MCPPLQWCDTFKAGFEVERERHFRLVSQSTFTSYARRTAAAHANGSAASRRPASAAQCAFVYVNLRWSAYELFRNMCVCERERELPRYRYRCVSPRPPLFPAPPNLSRYSTRMPSEHSTRNTERVKCTTAHDATQVHRVLEHMMHNVYWKV